MLERLLARWRLWEEALAGSDDPRGDYLLHLDERVSRLEAEIERRPLPVDAVTAVRPTNGPETE